jgi:hypothetical protein
MQDSGPPILSDRKPPKYSWSRWHYLILGIVCGVAYACICRACFAFDLNHKWFEIMSQAFIIGVPLAGGFISTLIADLKGRRQHGLTGAVITPLVTCAIFVLIVAVTAWEGLICIFLWLPLLLGFSYVGSFLGFACARLITTKRNRIYCVVSVALLPFFASPLEQLRQPVNQVFAVPTQIKIHAAPEAVWQQIRTVPLIQEREQSTSFSHRLGFPRPVEARLVGEGVGAVRYATFERGVLFVETITEWQEPRKLSFSIRADTEHIPPTTFDEHVIIGGKYFDVLDGSYSIEDIGNGDVILHLSSSQRLSTRFNFYSHYWTEYLMADLQNYILRIIKKRCES